jgi:hypothetical protein
MAVPNYRRVTAVLVNFNCNLNISLRNFYLISLQACNRNNQLYALICTIPLFYKLAPRCFGSSLSSSGSFLNPSELLEIQIEWLVYHIMCGYLTCVPDCRGSVRKHRVASIWNKGMV